MTAVTQEDPPLFPVAHESRLALLAFGGQFVGYLLALLLARHLAVEGFNAYAVASAVFIMMATVAPRGAEKYALRLLPVLIDRADWPRAHGYLRFGARRTLQMSLLLALGMIGLVSLARDWSDATRLALLASALSLPAGALVHYGLEVMSAAGRELAALVLFRIVVPLLTLVLVVALLLSPVAMSGALAVASWGVAWLLVLALMVLQVRNSLPLPLLRAQPVTELSAWQQATRPFFIFRISLGLLGQSGIIALDWLDPSATATGAYAAAVATVSLAAVLATATNRAYSRQLTLLLGRRQYATVFELRRKRLRWLLPVVSVFLVATFVFAGDVLALFRPEFIDEGITPLRLLAVVTSFTVLFALAPTYLKYQERRRVTYVAVALAAAVQLLLLWMLVPSFGATGAALAYTISIGGMYACLAWMAQRELAGLSRQ